MIVDGKQERDILHLCRNPEIDMQGVATPLVSDGNN